MVPFLGCSPLLLQAQTQGPAFPLPDLIRGTRGFLTEAPLCASTPLQPVTNFLTSGVTSQGAPPSKTADPDFYSSEPENPSITRDCDTTSSKKKGLFSFSAPGRLTIDGEHAVCVKNKLADVLSLGLHDGFAGCLEKASPQSCYGENARLSALPTGDSKPKALLCLYHRAVFSL